MMLSAQQMRSLPSFFTDIADATRRAQGRRHSLPTVLAIAGGAILCGMRGYKAIADWAQSLAPRPETVRCRRVNGRYWCPAESIIRDVMIRVDPDTSTTLCNAGIKPWPKDSTLAIDGKTMCNALDHNGHQTHVMSVVGHHTKTCYTQKKLAACQPRETPKS